MKKLVAIMLVVVAFVSAFALADSAYYCSEDIKKCLIHPEIYDYAGGAYLWYDMGDPEVYEDMDEDDAWYDEYSHLGWNEDYGMFYVELNPSLALVQRYTDDDYWEHTARIIPMVFVHISSEMVDAIQNGEYDWGI